MSAQPMEVRIAHLEGAFDQVNERLNSIDRRLETGMSGLRSEMTDLRSDMNQRFNWLVGLVAGSWVTMIGMWITTMLTILFHRA